jgi:CRP/FNR family transcriptional regulator, nitrogen fixation regulation protein
MLTATTARPIGLQPRKPAPGPVTARDALQAFDLMGSRMNYGPNEEIYGEGEPADFVYKVLNGAVRTYKIWGDGQRQISAFYFPGDIFGIEAGRDHLFSAEAIGKVSVRVIRRSALVSSAERDGEVARELWHFTARELSRVQEHMLLLVKSAQQRVACFLLEMSERLEVTDAVNLPMSRQDIADYLGLTIETVSRVMSQLVSESAIRLPRSRRVVLHDRAALRQLNA